MTSPDAFQVVMTAPRLAEPAVAALVQAGCTIHYMEPYPSAQEVEALTAEVQAHAILTRQGPVTAAAMAASARLRIIARHGVGVDDVDLQAARARGIIVARAPGSNTVAVAEHTMAMILAMAKDFRALGEVIATGKWRGDTTKVRDIYGMRLGLLGFGAIGRQVAKLALPFGMDVIALPRAGSAIVPFHGVAQVPDLDTLLRYSDVLSVHCPYSPETHHIINASAFSAMPRGSYLINTARGGIIDEAALAEALRTGHIAGAALDVFEREPPPPHYDLRRHPKVLATPHVSGVTDRSLVNMGLMAAECIVACLTNRAIPPGRLVVG
jgi:D-3-phosphoglycerate dehydrogenase / 2-oxoglutarate reductase